MASQTLNLTSVIATDDIYNLLIMHLHEKGVNTAIFELMLRLLSYRNGHVYSILSEEETEIINGFMTEQMGFTRRVYQDDYKPVTFYEKLVFALNKLIDLQENREKGTPAFISPTLLNRSNQIIN